MKIPQGSESFFFEEAYIHRKLTESLHNMFNSWGYIPVETPVFDLFDVYRTLIPPSDTDKIYRLIDREGDLLMLRSDITLFLARQMGLILSEKELPARICYSDSILRHQNFEDISHNEFFQSGIELIGKSGFEGDIEVLLLLYSTIDLLEIPAEVHLGSHSLFNRVFIGFNNEQKTKLLKMISLRDFKAMEDFCTSVSGKEKAAAVTELFRFIGNTTELKDLINSKKAGSTKVAEILGSDASDELEYIIKLSESLDSAGFKGRLQIDLSEVGSQAYHTGIVFQVYMHGIESAVISGGRYDNLLAQFGIDAPSVGFSLLQRKIEPGIGSRERFMLPERTQQSDSNDIIERFKNSERLRKEGKIITL